ncbi:MAG TPA: MBL fold metallo-hydrolase [Bryobacteraceae bacterium]|nr:MBL fold metallo-hydrolase [Bryobacteraceae bacterium]
MRLRTAFLAVTLLAGPVAAANLNVYVIDVEGGKSVLMVSPSGQTMLIDAGWPAWGDHASSVGAIVAAAHAAGVKQIDNLLITHYDIDHAGDMPGLTARIPVRHFFDHGDFRNGAKTAGPISGDERRFQAYSVLREKIGHTVVQPGDTIPLEGVEVRVVAAGGKAIRTPLPGAGEPNRFCAQYPQQPVIERDVEDNLSAGVVVSFGKFRMLDLADLEAHHSRDLVCPNNLIGTVDVYNVNVHAQIKGVAPELVNAIRARAMLVANGSAKGGDPESWPILRAAAGLEDIWQEHFTVAGGPQANAPADFIANPDPDRHGNWIQVSAAADGSFTITNSRNGFHKVYPALSKDR